MSNYNYLKIDFYGQFNADTIHKLTYPEPFNPMASSSLLWLNPITDPRAIRTLFPMAKYGYRIHRDQNGTYYSYLTRYERDARQGYVAITVMIGAQFESLINGKTIFNLLNLLKTNVLDSDNITAAAVEQCLIASKMPIINAAPLRITPVQNHSQQAFRVYSTNEELYDIFQFPKQSEYNQYGEVFFINKLWCNNTVPGVALLTSPIIKTYSVTKPASVKCDSTTQTGKTLNITYTKEGFAPLAIPITVNGINNQYVRYDGANITILIPDNLPFKQRMNVRVRINGISYNDSKVRASVAGVPLHYSSQLSAYTSDVSKEMLSEADIKVSVNIDDPLLDPTGKSQRKAKIFKWVIPIITLLLGAAIGAGATWYLMKDGTTGKDKKVTTEVTDSTTLANMELDIKYLNDNSKWLIDSLKSEKYRNFACAIANGDVENIMKGIEGLKDKLKNDGNTAQLLEAIANKIKQDPEAAKAVLKKIKNTDIKIIDLEAVKKELTKNINNAVDSQTNNGNNDKPSSIDENTNATSHGAREDNQTESKLFPLN